MLVSGFRVLDFGKRVEVWRWKALDLMGVLVAKVMKAAGMTAMRTTGMTLRLWCPENTPSVCTSL